MALLLSVSNESMIEISGRTQSDSPNRSQNVDNMSSSEKHLNYSCYVIAFSVLGLLLTCSSLIVSSFLFVSGKHL